MSKHVLNYIKQLFTLDVQWLFQRFVCWTQPLCIPLPLATAADLFRCKPQLVAENALLRQQLMILRRQIKRPAYGKTDRLLLVLLASMVRTWKQALFLVQPETLLRLPSGAFPLILEAQIKGAFEQAKTLIRDDQLDQRDSNTQPTLGSRAHPWGTPQAGYPGE